MIRSAVVAQRLSEQPEWRETYQHDPWQHATIKYLDRLMVETERAMRDAQVPEPVRARVLQQVVETALPDARTVEEQRRALTEKIDLSLPLPPDMERLIADAFDSH